MNIPKDPVMLLSVINTALRDRYESLESLCSDQMLDAGEIQEKLAAIDYYYNEEQNRFV